MNPDSPNKGEPRRLRERIKEATQVAILEAAEEVFGAQGFNGARMEDVARRAGVAVGTVYNHFEDRETLFNRLALDRKTELLGRIDSAMEEAAGRPFEERLRAVFAALVAHIELHRQFLTVVVETELAHQRIPSATCPTPSPRHAMQELHARLHALAAEGVTEGVLRNDDADIHSTVLIGMLRGAMVRHLFYPQPNDRPLAEMVGALVRFFLRGAAPGGH